MTEDMIEKEEQEQFKSIGMSYIKEPSKYRAPLDKFLDHFITILFIFMTVIILLNVFSRFLPFVIYWAEISARMAGFWITFVGAAILVQKGEHIRVNYFDEKITKTGLYEFYVLLSNILILAIGVGILYGSYLQVLRIWPEYITAWPVVRYYWWWLAPLVGMVFLNIYAVINLVVIIKSIIARKKEVTMSNDEGGQ